MHITCISLAVSVERIPLCPLAASTRFLSPAGPSVPQYVTVSLLSDTSIYVEWLGPTIDGGDGNITYNITVTYQPHVLTRTTMMMSTTITGLEAPRTYLVEVTAINRAGASVPGRRFIHFQGNVHSHDASCTYMCGNLIWNCSDRSDRQIVYKEPSSLWLAAFPLQI